MHTVFLSLGSNLGDKRNNLSRAAEKIAQAKKIILSAVSQVYVSEPVGCAPDMPKFLNQVLKIQVTLTPLDLLEELLHIEKEMGRVTKGDLKPRYIDIDMLLYDSVVMTNESLVLPHPRFRERRFVLAPLSEIAPKLKDPVTGKTVQKLLAECSDTSKINKTD